MLHFVVVVAIIGVVVLVIIDAVSCVRLLSILKKSIFWNYVELIEKLTHGNGKK